MNTITLRLDGVTREYPFTPACEWSVKNCTLIVHILLYLTCYSGDMRIEYKGASSWYIFRDTVNVGYAIAKPNLER